MVGRLPRALLVSVRVAATRVAATLAGACLAALPGCSSGGGGSSSGNGTTWVPLPLGTVTVLAPAYSCGTDTFCYDIEVACPGILLPAKATLRVASDPLVASRGTILLTSGSQGKGFYGDEAAEAPRIMADMHAAGFTTVELKWIDSWLVGSSPSEGQALLACRPATVARWVYDNLHAIGAGTAFCATGNSGGAAQIMYSVTHYGLDSLYSLVVPTGGPPMSRIDWGCLPGTGPDPDAEYEPSGAGTIDLGYGFPEGAGPCSLMDPSYVTIFQGASEAFGVHDYFFPNTLVWLVLGELDVGATAQATILLDRLTQEQSPLVQQSIAPNTPHNVPSTVAGANLVRDILLGDCVPR
jgi:hypothetical protein